MHNFEHVNKDKVRKFGKWKIFWLLFAINLIGFVAAHQYFREQEMNMKAETEATDFNNKYGASVHGTNSLFTWGLELLHLLRGRN